MKGDWKDYPSVRFVNESTSFNTTCVLQFIFGTKFNKNNIFWGGIFDIRIQIQSSCME